MREYLLQLKTQAIELWQKMTRVQRIVIGCSAVLLFGTLVLLTRGATKPDYGPLFTSLDDQQAGQIVAKLQEKKVQYQISDSGSSGSGVTILVPTKDIPPTRLELASEGMPTGGVVGFESFDNTKFGETDTDRRARYLRALQGELTRTIEGMAEVDQARVHIVQPEPSIFTEEEKNATAAIMLKLKANKSLQPEQVLGLVKLVTNSVEGLKSENVTVVDMAGNVLSEDIGTDADSKQKKLTVTQVELQKSYQKEVQNSVQSMMEQVVGVGKAVVRVQAQLNFDAVEENTKQYGNKVVRSEQVNEENSKTTTNSDTGAPGTDSNIPGYETGSQTGNSEINKSGKIKNYEIDETEQHKILAPGSVKRLSVAVVVDKEVDSKTQKQLEDIVKTASGYDQDRGDQISVSGVPFNTEYQEKMETAIAEQEKQQQMLVYAGLAALALAIIGGVVGSMVVKRRRAREMEMALQQEMEELGQELKSVPVIAAEEEITEFKPEISPEEKERKFRKDQVEKVASEHPDDIAQLLRTWLAEE